MDAQVLYTKNHSRTTTYLIEKWGIRQPGKFALLGTMVFFDSLIQAVFLTFLGFIMINKGAHEGIASMAVVLALVGGMIGKYICGLAAARLGDRVMFFGMQLLTLVGLIAVIQIPANTLLFLLPFIGLVIQGTSTVTYGSVADFVTPERQSRGYSLIYTASSISSVVGPVAMGLIADTQGLEFAIWTMVAISAFPVLFCSVLAKRGDGG